MIELLLSAWAPMLVAALAGSVAGWFWHASRMRPKQKKLEDERRRLRAELLDLAVGAQPQPPLHAANAASDEAYRRRIIELEHALAEARGRGAEVDVLRARLADLEQHTSVRPVMAVDVTDYTTRIAALEVEIEAARQKIAEAEELKARAASLEAAEAVALPAPAPDESDLTKWRARYFEARTSYLEQAARAADVEMNAMRARLATLESQPAAPAADDAEKTQLIWRNRYLTERLKYVEGEGAAAAATDRETDDRRRWRMRYLEQRLAHLESGGREPTPSEPAAPAEPPVDVERFKTRIAELEGKISEGEASATKLIDAEDEVIRSRWTTRYLQARVKYLEDSLGRAAAEEAARAAKAAEAPKAVETPIAPQPVAAPEPVRAPEPVVFRMERPPTLSGARNGAPDDFTLIDGVSAQSSAALHAMGVHHFDQIAAWTPAHVAWVNQYFNLGGRIVQHRWVEQARKLANGG